MNFCIDTVFLFIGFLCYVLGIEILTRFWIGSDYSMHSYCREIQQVGAAHDTSYRFFLSFLYSKFSRVLLSWRFLKFSISALVSSLWTECLFSLAHSCKLICPMFSWEEKSGSSKAWMFHNLVVDEGDLIESIFATLRVCLILSQRMAQLCRWRSTLGHWSSFFRNCFLLERNAVVILKLANNSRTCWMHWYKNDEFELITYSIKISKKSLQISFKSLGFSVHSQLYPGPHCCHVTGLPMVSYLI